MLERDSSILPDPPAVKILPARSFLDPHLAALSYAYDELGVKETSTNWGPKVKEYLAAAGVTVPAAWCAAFVYWCVEQASKLKGVENPLKDIPLKAYVQSYYNYAKEHGKLIPFKEVGPGDLFLIYYPSLKRYGHIGFVYGAYHNDNYYETVEGNTNSQGGREGNEVALRKRKVDDNTVFFRYI